MKTYTLTKSWTEIERDWADTDMDALFAESCDWALKDAGVIKESLNEADDGSALEVEINSFFTSDDITSFAEHISQHMNEALNVPFEFEDYYMDDQNTLYLELVADDEDYNIVSHTEKIDIYDVKNPSDLVLKYADKFYAEMIQDYKDLIAEEG